MYIDKPVKQKRSLERCEKQLGRVDGFNPESCCRDR
jgi:hypothetical protein